MTIDETLIEQGGVMRCCLASVAAEHEGKDIQIGDTSSCPHCKTEFELVTPENAGETCYRKLTKPIWKPRWQLET